MDGSPRLWGHAPPIGLTGFATCTRCCHPCGRDRRVEVDCKCTNIFITFQIFVKESAGGRSVSCGCAALRETPLHSQMARRAICNLYGVPIEYGTALLWWAQARKAHEGSEMTLFLFIVKGKWMDVLKVLWSNLLASFNISAPSSNRFFLHERPMYTGAGVLL